MKEYGHPPAEHHEAANDYFVDHSGDRYHHTADNDLMDSESELDIPEDGADHIAHDGGDTVHDSRHVVDDKPVVTVTPRSEPEHVYLEKALQSHLEGLESPHPHQVYYPVDAPVAHSQPIVVDHVTPLYHQPQIKHVQPLLQQARPVEQNENAEIEEEEIDMFEIDQVQSLEP